MRCKHIEIRFLAALAILLTLLPYASCKRETPVTPTSAPPTAVPPPVTPTVETGAAGQLVADAGFRPEPNGFSFPNYGDEYPFGDLTIEDARLMFGDRVCERIEDDTCIPTPAAQMWVNVMNNAMRGGHCEGMAALSAEFFTLGQDPQDYGGDVAFELSPTQEALLRAIAYYWTLQTLEPVVSESQEFLHMTPAEIVTTLIQAIDEGDDFYTLGLYGPNGGHAVTPYAVEDRGNGVYWIHVYDNNYPDAVKYVEVDTRSNTWRYAAGAVNPEEDPSPWEGGSGTVGLTSLSARHQPLVCPFCGAGADEQGGSLTIVASGQGSRISATNSQGQRVAVENGQAVNEIPGAVLTRLRGNDLHNDDLGWLMILPVDAEYEIRLLGEANEEASPTQVALFQPGAVHIVDNIELDPGQQDKLLVSGTGEFSYTAGDSESPRLEFATDDPEGADMWYTITGIALGEAYTFTMDIDPETGMPIFWEDDPNLDAFTMTMAVMDDWGMQGVYFDVETGDGGWAFVQMDDDGSVMMGIDMDGDGVADENMYGEWIVPPTEWSLTDMEEGWMPGEEPTPEWPEEPTPEWPEEPTPEWPEEPTPEWPEEPTPEWPEEPTPEWTEEPTPEWTEEPTPEWTEEPTPEWP